MQIDFSTEQRRLGEVRKEEHLAVATAERHPEIDESQLRTMPNGNINDCRRSWYGLAMPVDVTYERLSFLRDAV